MNERNTIHNGDCLEFMKNYSGDINLVLTSPPYNMTKRPGGNADSGRYDEYNDWKEANEYLNWSVDLFNRFDDFIVNRPSCGNLRSAILRFDRIFILVTNPLKEDIGGVIMVWSTPSILMRTITTSCCGSR